MDIRVFTVGVPFMISCIFQSLVEPGFAGMDFIITLDYSVQSPVMRPVQHRIDLRLQ